jgi:hypothetical protein
MLIKFKTKNSADITMFGDAGLKLIKIMGHSGTVPGAIAADEIQSALTSLRAAASQDKDARADIDDADQDDESGERAVSLYQRALPLIELLEAAAESETPVMWEN